MLIQKFKGILIPLFLLFSNSLYSQNINLNSGLIENLSFDKNTGITKTIDPAVIASLEYSFDRFGIENNAVLFNSQQLLQIKNINIPSTAKGLSVSLWVKPILADKKLIVFKTDSSNIPLTILIDSLNGSWGWAAAAGNVKTLGTIPVDVNIWSLIVVTYNSTSHELKLFVKNENRNEFLTGNLEWQFGFTNAWIGGITGSPDNNFIGVLDNLYLYNRPLTNEEIDCLYVGCKVDSLLIPVPNPEDSWIVCYCNPGPTLKELLPGPAGKISTNSETVCPEVGNMVTFSVDPIERADYYLWFLPSGLKSISREPSITAELVKPITEGMLSVRGVNKKGLGQARYLTFVLKKKPVKQGYGFSISGPVEVCADNRVYTYKLNDDIMFSDDYEWTLPQHCTLIEKVSPKVIKVSFDYHYFKSGEISVVGTNSCGESEPVKISVKFIGVRLVKQNFTAVAVSKIDAVEKFSVNDSFEGAKFYKWKITKGLNTHGSSITIKEGTFFTNTLNVKVNESADIETLTVRAWSETCGYSLDSVLFVLMIEKDKKIKEEIVEKEKPGVKEPGNDEKPKDKEELKLNEPLKLFNKKVTYIDMNFSAPVIMKTVNTDAEGKEESFDAPETIANASESTPYYINFPPGSQYSIKCNGTRFKVTYSFNRNYDDVFNENSFELEGEISKDGTTLINCVGTFNWHNGIPERYFDQYYKVEVNNIKYDKYDGFRIKPGSMNDNAFKILEYKKTDVCTTPGIEGKTIKTVEKIDLSNPAMQSFDLKFYFNTK